MTDLTLPLPFDISVALKYMYNTVFSCIMARGTPIYHYSSPNKTISTNNSEVSAVYDYKVSFLALAKVHYSRSGLGAGRAAPSQILRVTTSDWTKVSVQPLTGLVQKLHIHFPLAIIGQN